MTKDPAENIDLLRGASPNGDGYDVVVEATGVTAVGRHLRSTDPQRRHGLGLRRHPAG